ncbi:MAG TPA: NAD(P)/FAD-dependent oxidoreductase [Gammaproteobacteria bacterium]|nr:NAD(P)/FAD-dependent oxidoreductase [Gammaproteobacteria bacterium]
MAIEQCDVLIIGAGPAGSLAAALLVQQGKKVIVIEREQFPRFSIGESLLPQSMEYLERANLLKPIIEAGFQHKNGAAFIYRDKYTEFDFRDKFSDGWGTTYQVERSAFDFILANEAQKLGADIRYKQTVVKFEFPFITIQSAEKNLYQIKTKFVLDASGFGRVLPKLLDLEMPSNFPVRGAVFTHIQDNIVDNNYDRNKIRIITHPDHIDVWYWLIPFSNNRCSIGIVAKKEFFSHRDLKNWVNEEPSLRALLKNAIWDTPAREIMGYASNVKSLYGTDYALLGNAGEFLDPIFSSGVTIAFKSAFLAANLLNKQFAGENINWQTEYATPLKKGVDTFRTFVESWYSGKFQNVIFHDTQPPEIRRMISSILAGYAWDENNPFVKHSERRLKALEELCNA